MGHNKLPQVSGEISNYYILIIWPSNTLKMHFNVCSFLILTSKLLSEILSESEIQF